MDELQPQLGISNCDRSRWKLSEQTMIRVRINLVQRAKCSNKTSRTRRQQSLIRSKPGHQIHLSLDKLKMSFRSRPPHRKTMLKDWENKCIVSTKQHRDVHEDTFHQPKMSIFRETQMTIPRTWSLKGEPAVKLHANKIEVGTSANGNPRQDRPSHHGE